MFTERYYQREAADAALNYFFDGGKGNPLILMPTGTGKSVVVAGIAKRVLTNWPSQRIIMATVAKELVDQNANKLRGIWPDAPLGICSASLRKFDTESSIIYGSIGTLANRVEKLGHRDLMIVDEAQAVSNVETSQLRKSIKQLQERNPGMPVIGLTATGYRMRTGMLTNEGGVFTDVAYNITDRASYNRLVEEGYLAPLVTRATHTHLDASKLHVFAGEFVQREAANLIAKEEIITAALRETCEAGETRQSWLIFVPDIDSIERCVTILQGWGIACAGVHSKMPQGTVDKNVAAFQAGKLRCMVVADKLTVGFDHAPIDLIACLRPTMSPGWWVQALGRGARPSPDTGKRNCLVLDFTGNTRRVGPVNDPFIPKPAGKKTGEAPIRICDNCGVYNHASARFCGGMSSNDPRYDKDNPNGCGHEFPHVFRLSESPDFMPVVAPTEPDYAWIDVKRVIYTLHEKDGAPPSMRVNYWYGAGQVSEWVTFEHPQRAGLARSWWRKRCADFDAPTTTREALALQSYIKQPKRIYVRMDTKYKEVKDYEF